MEANGQLRLRGDPPAEQRIAGPEARVRHLPDVLRRLSHAFQRHPLARVVERHQPQEVDADGFDAISRIRREIVGAEQDAQIVAPDRQALLANSVASSSRANSRTKSCRLSRSLATTSIIPVAGS